MVQTYQTQTTYPTPFAILAPAYFLRYPNPYAPHVLSTDVLERRIVYRRQDVASAPPAAEDGASSASTSSSSSSSGSVVRPVLLTSRLILKKGTLPSWAPRGLIKNSESWVLEVSEVDLDGDLPGGSASSAGGVIPEGDSDFTKMYPPRGELARPADGTWQGVPAQSQAGRTGRQMRTWTRNVDHTTVLAVAEGLTFSEVLPEEPAQQKTASTAPLAKGKGKEKEAAALGTSVGATPAFLPTHCLISAHITSDVSVLWGRIEKFGIKRFKAHIDTSRQGLLHTSSLLSHNVSPFSQSLVPPRRSGPLANLRESLRPPWLDGLPLSPLASLRLRLARGRERWVEAKERAKKRYRDVKEEGIWGHVGRKEREEGMADWREAVRERLVRGRQRWWGGTVESRTEARGAATAAVDKKSSEERQSDGERSQTSTVELPRERAARLAQERKEGR
ncbi:hypothetical protein BCV69DRAFT_283113 [Microstroma glucosiphilum]|uniref:PRELI/MSF1 domain-containing protein n=1 Tax=Pseudomicrostroma glucosiphilum TaxID=1684307 RepID=A0A316UB43_9BASI|nr:hypothetical protein BCV69DRAFT_283113 [Pseudomicrostroma glucosiphilum]PWN20235.1 hypothetical protein BCV69DRAFT_283113 [Pseudomicrostroma glucosiphilum]